jgi:glucose-6-phosphate isomerase
VQPASTPPALLRVDPLTGVMTNATRRYEQRLGDLGELYQDRDALAALLAQAPDRLAYEVHDHRVEERGGDLIFGTSVLLPGTVGREYAMTRGHAHRIADRTEIYHCLRGRGVLLMEDLGGRVQAAELAPGAVVYVAAHWIHRSVNVGDEPLVTLFCYPADAGQDYEVIERSRGMAELVVDDGAGGWALAPNPAYLARRTDARSGPEQADHGI